MGEFDRFENKSKIRDKREVTVIFKSVMCLERRKMVAVVRKRKKLAAKSASKKREIAQKAVHSEPDPINSAT